MRLIFPLLFYLLTAVNLNAAVGDGRIAEYSRNTLTSEVSLLREYIWLGSRPLAVVENGETYFLTIDHIGRPVAAVDMSGAVAWRAGYAAFGAKTSGTPTDQRFAGQWFQEESGLHHNWMRDYDPTTGRYIQPDPLGLIDGPSVYGYAGQNPVMKSDPMGLFSMAGSLAGAGEAMAGANVAWGLDPVSAAHNQLEIQRIHYEMMNGTGCGNPYAVAQDYLMIAGAGLSGAAAGAIVGKGISKWARSSKGRFFIADETGAIGKGAGYKGGGLHGTKQKLGIEDEAREIAQSIKVYGKLPNKFITKEKAKSLGWNPRLGNLATVAPGKSIGGNVYRNRTDPQLPTREGRIWYEADLNFTGSMRGPERLLYSSDGFFYVTVDHYKSFFKLRGVK